MSGENATATEHNGREYKIRKGAADDSLHYPQSDHHIWNEFAGLAIEFGGYNDISAVDPYTGNRFWLADAFRCNEHAEQLAKAEPGGLEVYRQAHGCTDCGNTFAAIRRLLDAMEVAGFPDNHR